MRNGILVSGNWVIDQVKVIDCYPDEERLVNVLAESSSNGGSAYNVVKALAKLKAEFPLSGLGLVGNDERGVRVIEDCRSLNIDVAQLRQTDKASTSYTDVMTVKGSGKRTFFHQRGANALLDIEHFDFGSTTAKIFHLGYLLLLDQLDKVDADGSTRASKVLKTALEYGFITSADIVSERSDKFTQVIPSSLPFLDYFFVNEFEAEMLTGIKTVEPGGYVLTEQCYQAACKIITMGVRKWVILHFPVGAIAVSAQGEKLYQASVKLPQQTIAGAVGGGDAFAAGVLMGVHQHWTMEQCLKLAVCSAAACLTETTSSDGILPADDCLLLADMYGFRDTFEDLTTNLTK